MCSSGAVVVVVEGGIRAAIVRDGWKDRSGVDELVRVGCSCAVAAREEGVTADVVVVPPGAARVEQKEKIEEEAEMVVVVREITDLQVVEQATMSSQAMVMVRCT